MRLGHEHEWLLSSMQFLTLELAARGLDIVSPGTAYIDLQAVLAKHVLEPLNRRYCRSLKFASRGCSPLRKRSRHVAKVDELLGAYSRILSLPWDPTLTDVAAL